MGNFTETQLLIFALIGASNIVLIGAAFFMLFSGRKVDREENKILAKMEINEVKKTLKSEKENVNIEPEIISDTFYDRPAFVEPEYHENKEEDYAEIDRYEEEQEKTAIISYQELLKAKQEAEFEEKVEYEKDEYISPVHGRVTRTVVPPQASIEATSNIEFLKSLKEFRKNL